MDAIPAYCYGCVALVLSEEDWLYYCAADPDYQLPASPDICLRVGGAPSGPGELLFV